MAATYAGGTGPFAARACATTEGAPTDLPGEPENLRVAQVGSNYVVLGWDKPSVGGEVEYYEWRSNIHDATRVTPSTATSVRVGGLTASEGYDFQLRARNSYGPGQWSQSIRVALSRSGGAIESSPQDLEVEKGGSGSFNVRLKRSPDWPLMVYFHSIGPDCLTEGLAYQQFKILLPQQPASQQGVLGRRLVGLPENRYALPWRSGVDVRMDASGCQGGETTVVEPIFNTVPFSYLERISLWDWLNLSEEEWREKWGIDPLEGVSGPSVKVTVSDGGTGTQQGGDPGAGLPTAVTLVLGQASVAEKAGQVTLTATLDAPAPAGGSAVALYPDPEAGSTAERDADYTMPDTIAIPAGERSGTARLSVVDDALDEEDETANLVAFVLSDVIYADLAGTAVLTIVDDDTAGVSVAAANPLEVDEGGTAAYTVVLDSRPTSDVTVSASSGDGAKVSVSPGTNTFTPGSWDRPLDLHGQWALPTPTPTTSRWRSATG